MTAGHPAERAVVVTTIFPPSRALCSIAHLHPEWALVVVGDRKTPEGWTLEGARYLSLADQDGIAGHFARASPRDHYSRKNVGYLYAIKAGARVIVDADDDSDPYPSFLHDLDPSVRGRLVEAAGWTNAYRFFTDERIWPRGFPLEMVAASLRDRPALGPPVECHCPVQQFLVDGEPDVDAVYRMTVGREVVFGHNDVVLARGAFCPFNSQNTVWWPDAYPLLYLPSFVTFRVTDIWRSLVAQVCLHAAGRQLAFRSATARHARNDHSLLRDFTDEVPGYLHNARILDLLRSLDLSSHPAAAAANLRRCYLALVDEKLVCSAELELVDAWLDQLQYSLNEAAA